MNKWPDQSDLQHRKRVEDVCAEQRALERRSNSAQANGGTNPGAEKQERIVLSDETIALAFSYHFTWGYPDYMRDALRLVSQAGGICDVLGIDPNRDLTWRQLRLVFEEADSTKVRYLIASNPQTSPAILNYLATDKETRVVRRVADNQNTHASTLARLAVHDDPGVRTCICENGNAPELVLLALARDPHLDVRYTLAENLNAPMSVIEMLTMDENPYISSRAQRTLNMLRPAEVLSPDFSRVARRRIGRAANIST
jgi:hypothetical protein